MIPPSPSETAASRNQARAVWIGCSGYVYKHWKGVFYPPALPGTRWLEYYARYFPTVELNNSFYRLPEASTFAKWAAESPEGFVFAVKASRFITHMKKLTDAGEHVPLFFERASNLGTKLGPVLYQLPPRWRFNRERLEAFLAVLPKGIEQCIEVREPSWLNDTFFELLAQYGVAYCIASLPQYDTPVVATAPFVYLRFHGAKEMYYYRYSMDELRGWRDVIMRFVGEGRRVYAYFNNDPNAWAVENALELTALVNEAGPLA